MKLQIASVSSKGQVVIPGAIRSALGITAGSKLAVMTDGENVLMKPVLAPRMKVFKKLAEESRKAARKAGLTTDDVKAAITGARRARRH